MLTGDGRISATALTQMDVRLMMPARPARSKQSFALIVVAAVVAASLATALVVVGSSAPASAVSGGTVTTIAGGTDNIDASGIDIAAHSNVVVDGSGNLLFFGQKYGDFVGPPILRQVSPTGVLATVSPQPVLPTDFRPTELVRSSGGTLYVHAGDQLVRITSAGIVSTLFDTGSGFSPSGPLAADAAGNLYVPEYDQLHKITLAGVDTVIAGVADSPTGPIAGQANGDGGPATAALFGGIYALTLDGSGSIYLVDGTRNQDDAVVRKIATNGVVTRVAGAYGRPSGDLGDGGSALAASFYEARSLAVNGAGAVFVGEFHGARVRKISGGTISTYAGPGPNPGGDPDGDGGPATAATLGVVDSLALDATGDLFVQSVQIGGPIRKITPAGIISTIAGGGRSTSEGRPATQAVLDHPAAAARDSAGNIYISDRDRVRIRKIAPNGTISTYAGTGDTQYPLDNRGDGGPATSADLYPTGALLVDKNQDVVFVDREQVRRIDHITGVITTIVGTEDPDVFPTEGVAGRDFKLMGPSALAVNSANDVFIATTNNSQTVLPGGAYYDNKVIKLDHVTGLISYVVQPFGTTPATKTALDDPRGLAVDTGNNVYVADTGNDQILKVTPAGGISTFAGTGSPGVPDGVNGDGGPATDAELSDPLGLTIDASNNLYVIDDGHAKIRQITPAGVITSIAGTGFAGLSGDGGPALSAQFAFERDSGGGTFLDSSQPPSLSYDGAGRLLVTDTDNNRIRQFSVPSIAVPGAPTAVSATPSSASVTVAWTAPASTGGTAITGYVVTAHQGTTTLTPSATVGVVNSTSVAGLITGLAYTFTVQAVNTVGRSAASVASAAATPTGTSVASAPTAVHATAGNATATVTWTAPVATGGSAITGSSITPIRNGTAQAAVVFADAATTHNLTGLTNGASYRFRVAAVNAVGTSALSATSNVVGPIASSGQAAGTITTASGSVAGSFDAPAGGAPDGAGGFYVADAGHNRVVRVTAAGTRTTFAGTGVADFSGDGGAATAATLNTPVAVALDLAGNVYIADSNNARIRKVTPAGIMSTFAGGGPDRNDGTVGDGGPATDATIAGPSAMAFDSSGRLYVANGSLRRVGTDGIITTVPTIYKPQSDGTGAKPQVLLNVWTLAYDPTHDDIVVLATAAYGAGAIPPTGIFRVEAGGLATLLAGDVLTSDCSSSLHPDGDDGPAEQACLSHPGAGGLAVDAAGTIYVNDGTRIRRVSAVPNGLVITPYVGTAGVDAGFSGDGGQAPVAQINTPLGIWTDASGALFVADSANNRIRRVQPGLTLPGLAAAPINVSLTASSAQVVATWAAPANAGGLPIDTYAETLVNGNGDLVEDLVFNPDPHATTHTWTHLTNGAPYTVRIQAVTGAGPGARTAPVTATPTGAATPPDMASNLVLTPGPGPGSITFTWAKPTHTGGSPITGATLFLENDGLHALDVDASTTAATFTHLLPANTTASIAYVNAIGTGQYAHAGGVMPLPQTVPSTMAAPAISGANVGTVSLSWPPQTSDGGAGVTDYVITPYIGATVGTPKVVDFNQNTTTMAGLTNGTAYTFTIAAENALGISPASPHSAAATPGVPANAPGAPTGVSAVAGDSKATVTWTAPNSTGGSPITSYVVSTFSGSSQVDTAAAGTGTSKVIIGLTNHAAYTFKVAAVNATGTGVKSAASNAITPVPPIDVPAAPTGVAAVAGNTTATVSWTAPAAHGSVITEYQVTSYIGSTPIELQNSFGTGTSHVMTGLTNGTTYTFKIDAVNGIGAGPDSAASNAVTPSATTAVPGPPTGVIAVAGDARATVSWAAPASNGGSAITSYRITPYSGATPLTTVTSTGSGTSKVITGLVNGSPFTFKVVAVNAVGLGTASAPSGAVTPAATGAHPYAPFASWSAFVTRQYTDLTNKVPSAADLSTWVGKLNAGTASKGDLDDGLRRSAENLSDVDPVVRVYRAFLGRAPDAGGLRFWIGRRRNVAPAKTWTVSQISESFTASNEFKLKYGALTNRQFVTRIYIDVLGRPADTAGVDYWTHKLDTKSKTRAQVMVGFSESNEYKTKQAQNTDLAIAYIYLLGRTPNAAETTDWTTREKAGTTNAVLLDELLSSAGYATHITG